ncbi:hypothetical protein GGI43DRAFT_410675 [Trichoderma evansii]
MAGGSRLRQNRSWPIASQSWRAAAERGEPQFKVSQAMPLVRRLSLPVQYVCITLLGSRSSCTVCLLSPLALPYLSVPWSLVPGKLICCWCLAGLFDALAAVLSNGCPVRDEWLAGFCCLFFSAANLS